MVIRVLLADDSRIMRDAIRSFLNGYSEIAPLGGRGLFANDRSGLRSKSLDRAAWRGAPRTDTAQ